jgi:hypothetical protein
MDRNLSNSSQNRLMSSTNKPNQLNKYSRYSRSYQQNHLNWNETSASATINRSNLPSISNAFDHIN